MNEEQLQEIENENEESFYGLTKDSARALINEVRSLQSALKDIRKEFSRGYAPASLTGKVNWIIDNAIRSVEEG